MDRKVGPSAEMNNVKHTGDVFLFRHVASAVATQNTGFEKITFIHLQHFENTDQ
jgi:hypothetical protein